MSTNSSIQQKSAKPLTLTSLIFVGAYLCQGISQHFCLISQPLNNFLKAGMHLDAAYAAFAVSLLMVPWVIKPIYGLASDYFGFTKSGPARRKFLLSAHLVAGIVYLALSLLLWRNLFAPNLVVPSVLILVALAGICIAAASVVWVAMTVDRSFKNESSRLYFGQQAVAYSCANMVSVYIGGWLCAGLSPSGAVSAGLGLAALPLFLLPILLQRYLPQLDRSDGGEETEVDLGLEAKITFMAKIKNLFCRRPFLLMLLFITLWNLSPSLGLSLYYYECDQLKFTQSWIGTLAVCTSAGSLLGSFAFRYLLADFFQQRHSTYVMVVFGVLSSAAYIFLHSPLSGIPIEFFRGFVFMVSTLAIYGLAADVSPKEVSATAMAIQVAVLNLATEGSIALGGFLYSRVFGKELLPLIVVSSLTTLLTAFLIPYLSPRAPSALESI